MFPIIDFYVGGGDMPPKVKFTKEEIVASALALVREGGIERLTAREVGKRLGASAKPIFGSFAGMEELQAETMKAAENIYQSYIAEDMAKGEYPPYKASGMAYIRFAKEEKELFKWLFMRNRAGEQVGEDREAIRPILDIIMQNLGINEEDAYRLHLQLWICVHGVATMIATAYLEWDKPFIENTLTDVYQGLKNRYTQG